MTFYYSLLRPSLLLPPPSQARAEMELKALRPSTAFHSLLQPSQARAEMELKALRRLLERREVEVQKALESAHAEAAEAVEAEAAKEKIEAAQAMDEAYTLYFIPHTLHFILILYTCSM